MDTRWNATPLDVHQISSEDDGMNRVCAAADCECSFDGCQHDGRRKPAQARFCSTTCASRAKKANYRKRKRRGLFAARHPEEAELLESTDSTSLAELHERAGRPAHWDDPETEFSDEFDLPHEHQDDDQGIYSGDSAPDPWQTRNEAFAAQQALTDAVEQVRARYERLLAPYRETMRRNIGVKPVAMARLEQQRDAEIRDLERNQQRAEALDHAARMAPHRAAQAAERQQEQAALNAFSRDLMGGSRRYQPPEWNGRATGDIAVW